MRPSIVPLPPLGLAFYDIEDNRSLMRVKQNNMLKNRKLVCLLEARGVLLWYVLEFLVSVCY